MWQGLGTKAMTSLHYTVSLSCLQVSRLKGQVTRYKNQVKELEEREDELMKEKRHQGKEVGGAISAYFCECVFALLLCVYIGIA